MYAAVGEALSNWATAETGLTMLFYGLCGTETRQQASAIMDTIISFDTRMDVVSALFALRDPSAEDAEFWRKFSGKCRKLYSRRHRIAHFRLLAAERKDGSIKADIAPFFSHEKWVTGGLKTLTIGEINELSERFIDLHDALLWMIPRVAAEAPPKEYFGQDDAEPPLITLVREAARQSLLEQQQQQ